MTVVAVIFMGIEEGDEAHESSAAVDITAGDVIIQRRPKKSFRQQQQQQQQQSTAEVMT